jgi:hypothetical protein
MRVPFGLTRQRMRRLLRGATVRHIVTRLNSDLRRTFYGRKLAFALSTLTNKTNTFTYFYIKYYHFTNIKYNTQNYRLFLTFTNVNKIKVYLLYD